MDAFQPSTAGDDSPSLPPQSLRRLECFLTFLFSSFLNSPAMSFDPSFAIFRFSAAVVSASCWSIARALLHPNLLASMFVDVSSNASLFSARRGSPCHAAPYDRDAQTEFSSPPHRDASSPRARRFPRYPPPPPVPAGRVRHDCVATFSPGETVAWSEREKAPANRERARGYPPRDVTRFTYPRGRRRARESMADWNREKTRETRIGGGWLRGDFSSRSRCNRTKGAPALRTSCVDGGRERDSSEWHRVRRVGNAMVRDRRTRARRSSGRRALVARWRPVYGTS